MPLCRGCGVNSMRTSANYDERMNFLKEVCMECSPSSFSVHHDASDAKVWTGPAAMPKRYKQYTIGGETQYCASDELRQDTVDLWSRDDEDVAVQMKRATRRTEPMTQEQIAATENWALNHLRPWMDKECSNRQYKHVDYDS